MLLAAGGILLPDQTTDVWLDGRYINKSFDVGMHSRLGDDHPAITVADKHTRTCLIEKRVAATSAAKLVSGSWTTSTE